MRGGSELWNLDDVMMRGGSVRWNLVSGFQSIESSRSNGRLFGHIGNSWRYMKSKQETRKYSYESSENVLRLSLAAACGGRFALGSANSGSFVQSDHCHLGDRVLF